MRPLQADKVIGNVGRRIAELRREGGRTQQDLANDLDVSLRHVQAMEAGAVNLSIRKLVDIANVLHAPLPRLLEPPETRKRRPGRPKKT